MPRRCLGQFVGADTVSLRSRKGSAGIQGGVGRNQRSRQRRATTHAWPFCEWVAPDPDRTMKIVRMNSKIISCSDAGGLISQQRSRFVVAALIFLAVLNCQLLLAQEKTSPANPEPAVPVPQETNSTTGQETNAPALDEASASAEDETNAPAR